MLTCVIILQYDVCCVVDDDDAAIGVSYDVTKLGQFVGLKRHWVKVRKDKNILQQRWQSINASL